MKDRILKLREQGLSYNEIQRELKCSKGTISKYCSNDETKLNSKRTFATQESIDELNEYLKNHTYAEAATHFSISIGTIKHYGKKVFTLKTYDELLKSKCESTKKLRTAIKRQCVEYLGGKCNVCGYDRCLRSLDFHHIDPDKKDFQISSPTTKYRFEHMKSELDKCLLLCKNCHGEIHEGIIKVEDYV